MFLLLFPGKCRSIFSLSRCEKNPPSLLPCSCGRRCGVSTVPAHCSILNVIVCLFPEVFEAYRERGSAGGLLVTKKHPIQKLEEFFLNLDPDQLLQAASPVTSRPSQHPCSAFAACGGAQLALCDPGVGE